MASLTQEHTVPQSRNETQVRTGSLAQTPKSAFEHFHEDGRELPGVVALWCVGIVLALSCELEPG